MPLIHMILVLAYALIGICFAAEVIQNWPEYERLDLVVGCATVALFSIGVITHTAFLWGAA